MRAACKWIAMVPCLGLSFVPLKAQQPPSAGPSLPPYRSPALALVQPAAGGTVPSDKPIVVFRFAPGEPNDPIDAHSFAVVVDGADRTAAFQVTGMEAWGALVNPGDRDASPGTRQVFARICSARGACAEVSASVAVIEAGHNSQVLPQASSAPTRRKVMDAVVAAIRKLLEP